MSNIDKINVSKDAYLNLLKTKNIDMYNNIIDRLVCNSEGGNSKKRTYDHMNVDIQLIDKIIKVFSISKDDIMKGYSIINYKHVIYCRVSSLKTIVLIYKKI